MNIGIKFKIPNEWGRLIKDILYEIECEEYIWKIDEDEVYLEDTTKNDGFLFPQEKKVFNNTEFMEIISKPSYYTVFVNIQTYFKQGLLCDMQTYDDFLKSDCEIILLITDNIFVNIYAKTESIIEKIKANAINNNYTQIKYITDENNKMAELRAM